MPERWEHELKKLRTVEQPSTLEDRVAEGPHPHHEPGRPTRERVAAAIVAFAVCAAVGVFGYRTLSNDDVDGGSNVATGVPSGDGTLALDLRSTADAPTAKVSYGDWVQDAVIDGYNWCPSGAGEGDHCSSAIVDFAFYPPVYQYLVVPPGTTIEVVGDGSAGNFMYENPDGTWAISTEDSAVPDDDGRYAVKVSAKWPQGDATVWFGIQVLSSASAAPDVLTVDCTAGLAQTDTSVVRTQHDGLHVRVVNDSGTTDLEVQQDDGSTIAIREPNAENGAELTYGVAPGSFAIGCGRDVSSDSTVPFELVDPDDHFAPWDLTCGDLAGTAFLSSVPTSVKSDDAAAQIVGGLRDGDRLRGAGYGADTWRLGPTYVVDRGGVSVARLVLGEQTEPNTGEALWGGTLAVCDGTGIAFVGGNFVATPAAVGPTPSALTGPDAPTGTTAQPLPEEIVVRCEGLGPAVDRADVRLQPDGLHIEATNVADAELFLIASPTTEASAGPFSFDRVTERVVVDLPPGTYSVGCLVPQEDGTYPGRDEAPDAYVTVHVLPADDGATG